MLCDITLKSFNMTQGDPKTQGTQNPLHPKVPYQSLDRSGVIPWGRDTLLLGRDCEDLLVDLRFQSL